MTRGAWITVGVALTAGLAAFVWARLQPFTDDEEIAALGASLHAEERSERSAAHCDTGAADRAWADALARIEDGHCNDLQLEQVIEITRYFHDEGWALRHGIRLARD